MTFRDETKAKSRPEWEVEAARREDEYRRRAALPMWQRIEEAETIDDLKDILQRLAYPEEHI